MKAPWFVSVVTAFAGLVVTSCSDQPNTFDKQFSLGTNGTFLAKYDGEQRLESFQYKDLNGAVKLSGSLAYLDRKMERCDVSRVSIMDPMGNTNLVSDFVEGVTTSGSGALLLDSEWHSSGNQGDIHKRNTWFFEKKVLLQIRRDWPDDLSRVTYQFTGPNGIVLYTNTYVRN